MYEDLINRHLDSTEWKKIPWHDPEFSRRMLREHLTQDHDLASRRFPFIDRAVAWIHDTVLDARPSAILDLGCGPGFYAHRFESLGHSCTGIDFSPASIDYARRRHSGNFVLADVESTDYGEGYDLVCMVYGEMNAFSPASARRIVEKARHALEPGGILLLEVLRDEAVRQMGVEPPTWHTAQHGLFSDSPYIVLQESSFEDGHSCSWYHVIDAGTGALSQYASMHQAYTEDEYRGLLKGFSQITQYPSLTGKPIANDQFFVLVATK